MTESSMTEEADPNEPVTGVMLESEESPQPEEEEMSKSIHGRAEEVFLGWANDWARFVVLRIKAPIVRLLVRVTKKAAIFPKTFIISIIIFSIFMVTVGYLTNFQNELDEDNAWTPTGSRSLSHGEWIDNKSGFGEDPRHLLLTIHTNGGNVMDPSYARDGARRVFEAVDLARGVEGYEELCYQYADNPVWDQGVGNTTCRVHGITSFWNGSSTIFEKEIETDSDAIEALSALVYPNDEPVDRPLIMGYATELESNDPDNHLLESALSYVVVIEIPGTDPAEKAAEEVEDKILDEILALQDKWVAEDPKTLFRVEIMAYRSFGDEFGRAIIDDLPLLPMVFIVMTVLCVIIFSQRRDRVASRGAVGFGAVVTVLLAIMTGFGLLFMCGVPFSFLTQILPFIMFGIGLDDAFIIYGAYSRTDPTADAPERIEGAIEDIGSSITLTTTTTAMAFGLGCISDIPAVFWLCLYAFPTVIIDYFYQLTFFIAVLSLDERRVKAGRKDCCCCRDPPAGSRANCCRRDPPITEDDSPAPTETTTEAKLHFSERMMTAYGNFLMKTWVKIVVLLGFIALTTVCIISTTKLRQHFEFIELVPDDSYLIPAWNSYQNYYEQSGVRPGVYFRGVNQSEPKIQKQMQQYVNDLVNQTTKGFDAPLISRPPFNWWLRDFHDFVNTTESVHGLPFNDQVQEFLKDPVYESQHSEDMVFDADNNLIESRTILEMDGVNQDEVLEQVDALEWQRSVSAKQSINKGEKDWKFFTFDGSYYIWEFYAVTVDELVFTSIIGIVAVSAITLIAIPHWTGVLFIAPLVAILYVDLLGVIQFSGLYVNSITYIGMVLSIGLIVDYCMHYLLRYIECRGFDREKRVKESLRTMGASIVLGGISTLLGVVPLAFSTSEIIRTVFVIFIALVSLGLAHGLILLPCILSLIGPLNYLPELHGDLEEDQQIKIRRTSKVDPHDIEQALEKEKEAAPESAPDVVEAEGMDDVPLGDS